jgi:hypothetical protein
MRPFVAGTSERYAQPAHAILTARERSFRSLLGDNAQNSFGMCSVEQRRCQLFCVNSRAQAGIKRCLIFCIALATDPVMQSRSTLRLRPE